MDLSSLLEKAVEALRRDLNHIFAEVGKGPLARDRANALVQYIKVLSSIQLELEQAESALAKKSPEELEALAKEILTNR